MSKPNPLPLRSLALLHVARIGPLVLLQRAQAIVAAMTGNPLFPSPIPPLTTVSARVTDLSTAQLATATRAPGAVATRDERRLALLAALQALCAYVQTVADANPTTAASIIEEAGFAVRRRASRAARVFAARPGGVSGTLQVVAATAGPRSSYEWQLSVDGGKTWVSTPPTLQARTTLTGLTAQTSVELRYRAVTKAGAADWSAPISIVVQ